MFFNATILFFGFKTFIFRANSFLTSAQICMRLHILHHFHSVPNTTKQIIIISKEQILVITFYKILYFSKDFTYVAKDHWASKPGP